MSNSRKASSVEWLVEQIKKDVNLRLRGFDIDKKSEQAKAMHKEEYIDAWMNGQNDSGYSQKELRQMAEEDYNQTYGQ